jgi:thioredoxin reductase (NADPH)
VHGRLATNESPIGAGVPETPDRNGAFPRLDAEQRERLRGWGRVRAVESGEVLFAAGDPACDFFVIESGAVAIVQGAGRENRVVALQGEHRFLGELSMLTGQRLYLSGIVRDPGEVIQIPVEKLRKIVAEDKSLSDIILSAFIARRAILIDAGAGIKLIGSRYSAETRRLREFLFRNRMPHQWIDLEEDAEAAALLENLGLEPDQTPVVIQGNGEILRNPSNAELGRALGFGSKGAPPPLCDVIVVGSGPAGLSASLYAASEGLDVQAVEAVAPGGQASTSARIENYLGFPAGVSGSELAQRAGLQALKFGARLTSPAAAVGLISEGGRHEIHLSTGQVATGRTVVVATGAQYRRLDVPRIEDFEGGGVYYAATQAEAQLCEDDPVIVVGGGNSAGQAAMFLSQRASSCHLLIRGGDLGKSMSRYLVDQIERNARVKVCKHSHVVEVDGERELATITVEDTRSGERTRRDAKALFVFIGASPHTEWLQRQLACDDAGFLLTGRDVQGDDLREFNGDRPLFLETSRPGIFAVGDVHAGSIKRVASAVGEGAMAVRLIHLRLAETPLSVASSEPATPLA